MAGLIQKNQVAAIRVSCAWDEEAEVWYVDESTLPGLRADADTLDDLRCKLLEMIPNLLAWHAGSSEPLQNEGDSQASEQVPLELLFTGAANQPSHS